tara:strand:+ start:191 stop:487 length:297 start_codon:yes stop_codon:yes gene_type:complete
MQTCTCKFGHEVFAFYVDARDLLEFTTTSRGARDDVKSKHLLTNEKKFPLKLGPRQVFAFRCKLASASLVYKNNTLLDQRSAPFRAQNVNGTRASMPD